MISGSRGVVLIVWGKRGYGFAAYNLAVSLKYHSPSIPITLIAHPDTMAQVPDRSVFDNIVWNDQIITDPGRFKAGIYKYLPYEYNLYLDVDAFCFRPFDALFDRLIAEGGHYYTFINDVYDRNSPNLLPQMYWAWKDDIWNHFNLDDHKLPATQSSVQFIKKCEESEQLFELVEKCFDNPIPLDRLRNQWGGTQPDELYLNIALALKGMAPHIGGDVIWFGNNGSMKPRQLVHQYYFLSFFGYKRNIKPMFWAFYDSCLIKYCASRGGRHVYKQQFIKADKHANKNTGIQRKAPETPLPKRMDVASRPGTIHLFVSYFQTDNQRRNHELNRVMQANIDCPSITRIFNLGDRYDHPKVTNIHATRPSYSDFINCINENTGDYNIIANSDILFTGEIESIKNIDFHNTCLALSRWDIRGNLKRPFHHKESQDTWVFKGKVKPVSGDFILGIPGCDNRFAYELVQAGYRVINPCKDIKTYHLHEINSRSYTEADRIHGNYHFVNPETSASYRVKRLLLHQPGKIGDTLIVAPIAKRYSDMGYEVDWLCPEYCHETVNRLGYARPVTSKQGQYSKEVDLSFGIIQNTSIHAWWLKNRKNFPTFVHAKYHLAGIDVKERYNLQYARNEKAEGDLFTHLGLSEGDRYVLFHGSSDYGQPAPMPDCEGCRIITFQPVESYTIFDWRKVIENATEIHCIDSSLANFVEVLNPECKKVFYRVPERKTESWFDFNKWELYDMNLEHVEGV